jgi:hypothetical protein
LRQAVVVQYVQVAADRGVRAQTGPAGEQLELTGGPAPGLHRYQRCHAGDHLTAAGRAAAGSHAGCIAGAPSRAEYLDGLAAAGFADASVTFTRKAAPGMHSGIIRAAKPATA